MGLKCLLGHDFGDAEVEREREEEGDEMVTTVREVRTCRRCGERQVVSENTEVTSIRTPGEVGLDDRGDQAGDAPRARRTSDASAADSRGDPSAGASTDADRTDADRTDAGRTDADSGPGGSPGADDGGDGGSDAVSGGADREPTSFIEAAEADDGVDSAPSSDEDDGVILENERPHESAERGDGPSPDLELDNPSTDVDVTADAVDETELIEDDAEFIDAGESDGEFTDVAEDDAEFIDADEDADDGQVPWPEHDDVAADEEVGGDYTEWPSVEGDDEGFAAEPDDGEGAGVSFGGGLTPGAGGGAGDGVETDAQFLEPEGESGADAEFVSTDRSPADVERMRSAETEYFCPNCESAWPATESSLRPGDICRECHRGYVSEREL
ncbi:MAG: hypothetical protein ABEJ28_01130 [Salinigranum sp.]